MVDRVREVLGIQTQTRVLRVNGAAHAGQRTIQVIPTVKLHARLGRPHFRRLWLAPKPTAPQRLVERLGLRNSARKTLKKMFDPMICHIH